MPPSNDHQWCPFRPTPGDLEAIARDVAEIPEIQQKAFTKNRSLHLPDRVAHQYQIAGSKVFFQVGEQLPERFEGVGLFHAGAEYCGIGRISTGLGTPHVESSPDFLGFMAAFQTKDGARVDFLGINDPTSPADNHGDFMDILHATGESAGAEIPFIGGAGRRELLNLAAQQTVFGAALIHRMGPIQAAKTLIHLTQQTLPTANSSTAYQRYWTGVAEVGASGGKFAFVPVKDENHSPGVSPGEHHLSAEWKARQASGDIEFLVYWIRFLDEDKTPLQKLTHRWAEDHKQLVGKLVFPRIDPEAEETNLWALLAAEMGANPGNWVANQENSVREPATAFGNARKIAYQKSQAGRNALSPALYDSVFKTAQIGPELTHELKKRHEAKVAAGHVSQAPEAS